MVALMSYQKQCTVHHGVMQQPPLDPCRPILGVVTQAKMNGIIPSNMYSERGDVEMHWDVLGMGKETVMRIYRRVIGQYRKNVAYD